MQMDFLSGWFVRALASDSERTRYNYRAASKGKDQPEFNGCAKLELELELIQARMTQKPLLWVEVGKSNRALYCGRLAFSSLGFAEIPKNAFCVALPVPRGVVCCHEGNERVNAPLATKFLGT
jgi:hypothetical protein